MNEKILAELKKFQQTQLLRFLPELNAEEAVNLEQQLSDINFEHLDKLIRKYVLTKPEIKIPDDLTPAPFFPLKARDEAQKKYYAEAESLGKKLISEGKCACITVAGGQGTRLGFDAPKGTYPIAPVSGNSLFCYFASSILRMQEKYNCRIYWYIMTSMLNNAATVKFFEEHNYFGLEKSQLFFFVQGTMPAIDYNGKVLMSEKSSLALSPDGHGGTLLALKKSGALADMKQKGIEYLSYFQVDNPLVRVIDPLFLGLHVLEKSEMSAITLTKTNAFEKLGNFCVSGGKLQIIEYSDLPEKLALSTDAAGNLKFVAGSPAIHMINCAFIERLTSSGNLELPSHRADKKVNYLDEAGNLIKVETPNAVKLESFIFDALALADKTMVLEAERNTTFAPTKNQTGVDSVESCRELLMERDAGRLERAGVTIPRGADGKLAAKIELSPRLVLDDADAVTYVKKHNLKSIPCGAELYLD